MSFRDYKNYLKNFKKSNLQIDYNFYVEVKLKKKQTNQTKEN